MLALAALSCTEPGPRAKGSGSVRIGGEQPRSWSAPCVYARHTRWQRSLPHVIRVGEDRGWALEISANRRFRPGRYVLAREPADGSDALVAFLAEDVPVGAAEGESDAGGFSRTIRGTVTGSLEISRDGDSIRVSVQGESGLTGSAPIRATCAMGEQRR